MTLKTIKQLHVQYDEPIARFTAARLGGPADILAIAHSRQALVAAAQWAHNNQVRWLILGGGANVLVADEGFRGLVIINQSKEYHIDVSSGYVQADSGITLITLARRCIQKGLQGLEWAVSVPGTVGGAVVNNAGAHGGDVKQNLVVATVFDTQTSDTQRWPAEHLEYDYRHSRLKGQSQRYVVLDAIFQLAPGHDPAALRATADEYVAYRKRTQPPGASLGSVFKNPPGDYAGRLIDAAGLKGHQIGGVQVSDIHANFFVNRGVATAADYRALIQYVQRTVADTMGVQLELEIELLG